VEDTERKRKNKNKIESRRVKYRRKGQKGSIRSKYRNMLGRVKIPFSGGERGMGIWLPAQTMYTPAFNHDGIGQFLLLVVLGA
jgi:hypothetical protein